MGAYAVDTVDSWIKAAACMNIHPVRLPSVQLLLLTPDWGISREHT